MVRDGAPSVALPRPLAAGDAEAIRRVFAFQARGDIQDAIRSLATVSDPLLLGSVLADRYLGRHHWSTPDELSDWLARYGDQPEAPAIRALLLTRLPKTATPPPAADVASLSRSSPAATMPEDIDPPRDDINRQPLLDRTVLELAQRGATASALRLIGRAPGVAAAYGGQLRAEVAQVLFTRNEDAEALRVARLSVSGSAAADRPGLGFYIAGLSAWRLDRVELARELFEAGANAASSSTRTRSAAAFWAWRAGRATGDPVGALNWLHVAAEQRFTFHGVLARRILRMDTAPRPGGEALGQSDVDAVAATARGRRALALLQVGQRDRAEAELRSLWPVAVADSALAHAVLRVASVSGMMDCAAQMAASLPAGDGQKQAELHFALPRLRPAGGFRIDPTLVYALTRVESNFDPRAVSPAGARGLMQIMPATAQYITGEGVGAADRLHQPAFNLEVGQRYVSYLAGLDGIDNDLLRLLASYNSGPGNFTRWGAELHDQGDPLLFIEAIPIAETRGFVQHALVYSWIYAARMHLPAPSLDALAAGEFPRFTPPRHGRRMVFLTSNLH
ncbi:transglycosylase SLT domain-containing protein [Rhodopila sp.]|uniref:lytic transglycosylase domain-containing protein n=1 Tax=Rhodopila sp. TaxID=2480087 RepID=UPI003D12BFB5